jgi:energy-coupling factor transporter transmembrane protein EcfT
MAAAIAIRSGTARARTATRVLMSVSQLWLPRVAARAERVAAAMELRGFCRSDLPDTGATAPGTIDALGAGVALTWLAGTVALRLWV